MDDGKLAALPYVKQRPHGRVKTKETIQVEDALFGFDVFIVRAGNAQRGAQGIISRLAMRDDHVQGVCRATHENYHQHIAAWSSLGGGKTQAAHPAPPDSPSTLLGHGGGSKNGSRI